MKYLKVIRYTLLTIGLLVLIVFAKNINLTEIVDIIKQSGLQVIFWAFGIVLLNIFIKWVQNVYPDIQTNSELKFQEDLVKAGAREVEVFTYKGHLFGIGYK